MPGIPSSYTPSESEIELAFKMNLKNEKKLFLIILIIIFAFLCFYHFTSVTNIKPMHHDFVGRKNDILAMENLYTNQPKASTPVIVLWGEEGIGKSELAIAFAHQHLRDFNLQFMIDCSSKETYMNDYYSIANKLKIKIDKNNSFDLNLNIIHSSLQKKYSPWILIFDNVEIPIATPPCGNGLVVVTTRDCTQWKGYPHLEVTPFSPEDASLLISKITREEPSSHRSQLIQELGFFPMTLNMAAHYIAEVSGMTEQKYVQMLNNQYQLHLVETCRNFGQLTASWNITAQMLQERFPKALEIIHFCFFLGPKGIEVKRLKNWLNQNSNFSQKQELDGSLGTLINRAILSFDKETNKIYLHRLKLEAFSFCQFFKSSLIDQAYQFLIDNYADPEWASNANWFLYHHSNNLPIEKISHIKELINGKKPPKN